MTGTFRNPMISSAVATIRIKVCADKTVSLSTTQSFQLKLVHNATSLIIQSFLEQISVHGKLKVKTYQC